jgi:hypothetical protein
LELPPTAATAAFVAVDSVWVTWAKVPGAYPQCLFRPQPGIKWSFNKWILLCLLRHPRIRQFAWGLPLAASPAMYISTTRSLATSHLTASNRPHPSKTALRRRQPTPHARPARTRCRPRTSLPPLPPTSPWIFRTHSTAFSAFLHSHSNEHFASPRCPQNSPNAAGLTMTRSLHLQLFRSKKHLRLSTMWMFYTKPGLCILIPGLSAPFLFSICSALAPPKPISWLPTALAPFDSKCHLPSSGQALEQFTFPFPFPF